MDAVAPLRLLLLEDDIDLGQAVCDHLRAAGHQVDWCHTLAEAQAAAPPALALLDLRLPDGDGLQLLRQWRAAGQAWPVIVLTARDQVSDRIRGLQAGADDYLVKPFDLDELLARVAAVARRAGLGESANRPVQTDRPSAAGSPEATTATATAPAPEPGPPAWRVDLAAHQAWSAGVPQDLTQMEWAVLACLAQRPGRIYSRSEIEHRLLSQGLGEAASNSLEVIISRLRKKLGPAAISTHRGLGYRLEA